MNSIESYPPPKINNFDDESSTASESLTSDPSALEALRALMMPATLPAVASDGSCSPEHATLKSPTNGSLACLIDAIISNETLSPTARNEWDGGKLSIQRDVSIGSNEEMEPELHALIGSERIGSADSNRSETSATSSVKALYEALGDKLLSKTGDAFSAGEHNSTKLSDDGQINPEIMSLGSNILQSLGIQSTPESANETIHETGVTQRIEQVSTLMSEMADRILITDPSLGNTTELRIKIAENIMRNTEIRVWRENGGQLCVEFDTKDAFWARALNDSSTQLAHRLNERLNLSDGAQVTVQHQGGLPQDGRSRNRYKPWELAQQTAE